MDMPWEASGDFMNLNSIPQTVGHRDRNTSDLIDGCVWRSLPAVYPEPHSVPLIARINGSP